MYGTVEWLASEALHTYMHSYIHIHTEVRLYIHISVCEGNSCMPDIAVNEQIRHLLSYGPNDVFVLFEPMSMMHVPLHRICVLVHCTVELLRWWMILSVVLWLLLLPGPLWDCCWQDFAIVCLLVIVRPLQIWSYDIYQNLSWKMKMFDRWHYETMQQD